MIHKGNNAYVAWGEAILRRLDASTDLGSVVETWRERFRAVQSELSARNGDVGAAFASRHAHVSVVADASVAADDALEALLVLLPAAGLGDRKHPLRDVSALSPSDVHHLPPTRHAEELAKIVKAVRAKAKKTKNKPLDAAVDALDARRLELSNASLATGGPTDAYHAAVHRRDEELLVWQTTLAKLKRRVETHFEDTPARVTEIFAAPDAEGANLTEAPTARADATLSKAEKKAARAAAAAAKAAVKAAAKAKKQADKAAAKAKTDAKRAKRAKKKK
jgi:hypothetical protein